MRDEGHTTAASGPQPTSRDADLPDPTRPIQPRRGFLGQALTLAIGGIVALFPLVLGLVAFLDPLRKRRHRLPASRRQASAVDAEGFIAVARAESLPTDGTPQFFQIIADRTDAWTFIPNQPVGAVYLRRKGDDVIAYNVQCPHAGCTVDYDPVGREFDCPCHKSSFTLDGQRSSDSPSARDLDRLQTRIDDGQVLVKYENFRTGTAQKIAE